MTNRDIPYEQQMKILLGKYGKLIEENKMLREKLAKQPGELREAQHLAKKYKEKLNWVKSELEEYLVGLGIELPAHPTVSSAVKMITRI